MATGVIFHGHIGPVSVLTFFRKVETLLIQFFSWTGPRLALRCVKTIEIGGGGGIVQIAWIDGVVLENTVFIHWFYIPNF